MVCLSKWLPVMWSICDVCSKVSVSAGWAPASLESCPSQRTDELQHTVLSGSHRGDVKKDRRAFLIRSRSGVQKAAKTTFKRMMFIQKQNSEIIHFRWSETNCSWSWRAVFINSAPTWRPRFRRFIVCVGDDCAKAIKVLFVHLD